jgi:putative transposase
MNKYQNKYRIQSNRMPGWDYSGEGAYYITICVDNHNCIFGYIKHKKMILNDFGKIAHHEWGISAAIRDEIELDAFVIMPNHLHGIVIISKSNIDNNSHDMGNDTHGSGLDGLEGSHNGSDGSHSIGGSHGVFGSHVETHGRASLQTPPTPPQTPPKSPQPSLQSSRLQRKPKSISSFIAGYKSAVTTKINNLIDSFIQTQDSAFQPVTPKFNRRNRLWQVNYNDHVIRNNAEYNRIKTYIIDNPAKWQHDNFYQ